MLLLLLLFCRCVRPVFHQCIYSHLVNLQRPASYSRSMSLTLLIPSSIHLSLFLSSVCTSFTVCLLCVDVWVVCLLYVYVKVVCCVKCLCGLFVWNVWVVCLLSGFHREGGKRGIFSLAEVPPIAEVIPKLKFPPLRGSFPLG